MGLGAQQNNEIKDTSENYSYRGPQKYTLQNIISNIESLYLTFQAIFGLYTTQLELLLNKKIISVGLQCYTTILHNMECANILIFDIIDQIYKFGTNVSTYDQTNYKHVLDEINKLYTETKHFKVCTGIRKIVKPGNMYKFLKVENGILEINENGVIKSIVLIPRKSKRISRNAFDDMNPLYNCTTYQYEFDESIYEDTFFKKIVSSLPLKVNLLCNLTINMYHTKNSLLTYRGNSELAKKTIDRIVNQDDPYLIFELPTNTPISEIKKTYRRLSLLIHPDKCDLPGAEEAFKKLSTTFEKLNVTPSLYSQPDFSFAAGTSSHAESSSSHADDSSSSHFPSYSYSDDDDELELPTYRMLHESAYKFFNRLEIENLQDSIDFFEIKFVSVN